MIGGGPAGSTAALYATRMGVKTLLLEREIIGGKVNEAPFVENYPGFIRIQGLDLGRRFKDHLIKEGVDFHTLEKVLDLDLLGDTKSVKTNIADYRTKTVIIATGGRHRKLGVPGEDEFIGKGVGYCALCDATPLKGKKVAVIGSGNTASVSSIYLTKFASEVFLIPRGHKIKAERCLKNRIDELGIQTIYEREVTRMEGEEWLQRVFLKDRKTGVEEALDVGGVIVCIGILPESELARRAGVAVNERGYIKVDGSMRTNIDGVFAAGDITGGIQQITTSVGEGTLAAISACERLSM